MRAVGWPQSPFLSSDETACLTVVAGAKPRQVQLQNSAGADVGRVRLAEHHADIALLSTPRNTEWGTMLTLLRAPSLVAGPVPVAHRAGATLWFASGTPTGPSSPGHAVEWVEPGEWYLVASHLSTERHWWDIVGWGTGWGSTIEAELHGALVDNGLILIGVGEPIITAKVCFHNRTFSHDEVVSQADVRLFPGDPAITWNLSDDTLATIGTRQPALSWDATSARSRRKALQVVPARVPVWASDVKVPQGTVVVQINRSGDGLVVSAAPRRSELAGRTVSLMDTPYPVDDDVTA